LIKILYRVLNIFSRICLKLKITLYEQQLGFKINFISQGEGGLSLSGDLSNFKIDETSHLKANTFIECSGGVSIGKYFHTGRSLTIFSTNHNYDNASMIPYDELVVKKPVLIKDFVWCGSNVYILPGCTIGEGAVIGGGSVVTKDIPDYAVVGGNPAKIIKHRNISSFQKLKEEGRWY
jgi:acetyltransferase-like isoleucine patch superfamily enzyme